MGSISLNTGKPRIKFTNIWKGASTMGMIISALCLFAILIISWFLLPDSKESQSNSIALTNDKLISSMNAMKQKKLF